MVMATTGKRELLEARLRQLRLQLLEGAVLRGQRRGPSEAEGDTDTRAGDDPPARQRLKSNKPRSE